MQGSSCCAPDTSELCLTSFLICSLLDEVQGNSAPISLSEDNQKVLFVTTKHVHGLFCLLLAVWLHTNVRDSLSFIFLLCKMGETVISKVLPEGRKGECSGGSDMCHSLCLEHPPSFSVLSGSVLPHMGTTACDHWTLEMWLILIETCNHYDMDSKLWIMNRIYKISLVNFILIIYWDGQYFRYIWSGSNIVKINLIWLLLLYII